MKKSTLLLIAVFAVSTFLLSCATTQSVANQSNNSKSEPAVELTPKNSVLVYVTTLGERFAFNYAQMNPVKSPMNFKVKSLTDVVVFPLVEPASQLKILTGYTAIGKSYTCYYSMMLNRYYAMDIAVPNKPGLYFAGVCMQGKRFTNYEEFQADPPAMLFGPKNEEDFNKFLTKYELNCLKAAQRTYKKTEWEPIIAERIQELSK